MPVYNYLVKVQAATREEADQVMQERIEFDEDYGFSYTIGHEQYDPMPGVGERSD